MTHKSHRRLWCRKETLESPLCSPPWGHGPANLRRLAVYSFYFSVASSCLVRLVVSTWLFCIENFFKFWLVVLNSFLLILFSFNLSRLDEQLYLERCSILRPPFFPTIPPSYMYMRYPQDILPSPVGLISPVMHERWAYICTYAIMKIAFQIECLLVVVIVYTVWDLEVLFHLVCDNHLATHNWV